MDNLAGLLFLVFPIAVSAFVSFRMEKKREPHKLDTRPYTWGYYNAVQAIISAPLVAIQILILSLFVHVSNREMENVLILSALFGVPYALIGFYVLQRKRWAWILMILVDLTAPVVAVINIVYLRNRWSEMKQEAEGENPFSTHFNIGSKINIKWRLLSRNVRIGIFITAFWAIGTSIFVLLFEPYGRMRGDEWIHFYLVLLLPPAFINFTWFFYVKAVK
jgi:hypothetical protein